ncbi:MAG: CysS/YqeB C-terminal domain-containing protein [Pseudonocardia sp.]
MRPGRLVIMGSGETAPTMVEVHRSVLARTERIPGAGPALLLDTPYGFQENADELTDKAIAYFGRNVGRTVDPLCWRAPLDGLDLDRALAAVRGARWLFAGPGSPTYTMRVWHGSGLADAVREQILGGGTATFASAAALTVGAVTVPVYEVYKCGAEPVWVPGTDLLRELTGLHAAVIPHYDNTEGGTHSTRFCYLGERRLRLLESQLPAGAHVIGVDEHTALILDLAGQTAQVLGRGGVTVRRDGESRVLPAGTVTTIDDLARLSAGGSGPAPAHATADSGAGGYPDSAGPPVGGTGGGQGSGGVGASGNAAPSTASASTASASTVSGVPASLREAADQARSRFTGALGARDADAAAAAVLELEQALADWSTDSLQSDDADHARRVLRGMVLELASAARDGLADPRRRLAPLVEALLERRQAARDQRDFTTADFLRDRLADAGIDVADTSAGSRWSLRGA